MRFVSVLLTNAVVAIVATRGDGSTMKSEIRRGRNREVLPSCNPAVSTAVVRRGVPTSDSSPHGKAALHRSPAPEPAVHPSSSWRGPRETTSSNPHRRLIALPQQPPLLWLLRGGESHGSTCTRRDERRASEEHQRVRNVLLFYPNLIGYARIALVLTSYYLAETKWRASMGFYLVAFVGDAVDGHVARAFNQASRFGAVLDMVTDRCSTAGLLLVLSRLYGRLHAFAFLVLMFVDLFSHWMHTHSVVDKHHKSTTTLRRRNALIRTYYDHLPFFAFCCIGTELFYALLYLLHFMSEEARAKPLLRKLCFWLCLPACVLKQFINIAQIFSAARTLALEELDQQC